MTHHRSPNGTLLAFLFRKGEKLEKPTPSVDLLTPVGTEKGNQITIVVEKGIQIEGICIAGTRWYRGGKESREKLRRESR